MKIGEAPGGGYIAVTLVHNRDCPAWRLGGKAQGPCRCGAEALKAEELRLRAKRIEALGVAEAVLRHIGACANRACVIDNCPHPLALVREALGKS